jgi:hypothetical protein
MSSGSFPRSQHTGQWGDVSLSLIRGEASDRTAQRRSRVERATRSNGAAVVRLRKHDQGGLCSDQLATHVGPVQVRAEPFQVVELDLAPLWVEV